MEKRDFQYFNFCKLAADGFYQIGYRRRRNQKPAVCGTERNTFCMARMFQDRQQKTQKNNEQQSNQCSGQISTLKCKNFHVIHLKQVILEHLLYHDFSVLL